MVQQPSHLPSELAARSRWVRSLRPPVSRPGRETEPRVILDEEWEPDGSLIHGAVVFLINRECPWSCVMCDLWQHTTPVPLGRGHALHQLQKAIHSAQQQTKTPLTQIKIYNSGSFFDARAIYPEDHQAIAELLQPFHKVVVESHPTLVTHSAMAFADRLQPRLEIAMGLECAEDTVLYQLNKRFTLKEYVKAAKELKHSGIGHRAFVMIQPPFVRPEDALDLCLRTVDFALQHGADRVSLIPTRSAPGAMKALEKSGDFTQPTMELMEACLEGAIRHAPGMVYMDTWDLCSFGSCSLCRKDRIERLVRMNQQQQILPRPKCPECS